LDHQTWKQGFKADFSVPDSSIPLCLHAHPWSQAVCIDWVNLTLKHLGNCWSSSNRLWTIWNRS
jgi:hypothetical protein